MIALYVASYEVTYTRDRVARRLIFQVKIFTLINCQRATEGRPLTEKLALKNSYNTATNPKRFSKRIRTTEYELILPTSNFLVSFLLSA